MEKSTRGSMSSSRETPEDSGSSNVEKRAERNMNMDEEKALGLDGQEYAAANEQVEEGVEPSVRGRSSRRPSHDNRSLKTVRSHHSRAGGDGYTCFDTEPNNPRPTKGKHGTVTGEPYLVTWDGDADPENPRSMATLRRWIIVLICSASSLCV